MKQRGRIFTARFPQDAEGAKSGSGIQASSESGPHPAYPGSLPPPRSIPFEPFFLRLLRVCAVIVSSLVLSWLVACSPPVQAPVRYLIGVSQANLSEPWRISMTDEIQKQAALHPELRVIVADASDSLGKQIGDVETFEGLGIDLLIISPLESEALTPTVSRVFHSIPVIVLNRSVANDDYTLFIGPDNARIGQEAGRFVARTLQESGGQVLEILGRSGSPPTLERAQAFRTEVAQNPHITLGSPILANWLRDGAEDLVGDRLKAEGAPRVIFAHNDAMAYGAWLAASRLGLTKGITFVGVDGLPGPQGGQELLKAGILEGTFLSPTGGKEAVEYALALLGRQGEQPKKVILGTRFLTRQDLEAPPLAPKTGPLVWTVGLAGPPARNAWERAVDDSVRVAFGAKGWRIHDLDGGPLPEGLDALVTLPGAQAQPAAENQARARGLPLVRVGPQPPQGDDGGWTLAVGPDLADEGRRIGLAAADTGWARIAILAGPSDGPDGGVLVAGLRQGLADRPPQAWSLVLETDGTAQGAGDAVVAAFAAGLKFDAVVGTGDELVQGALRAKKTLKPGASFEVAGVGGSPEVQAAVHRGDVAWVVRRPSDLGDLTRTETVRALTDPGVSRRVITGRELLKP